jgi:hypothetical protein
MKSRQQLLINGDIPAWNLGLEMFRDTRDGGHCPPPDFLNFELFSAV